jgi:hypothetical protein
MNRLEISERVLADLAKRGSSLGYANLKFIAFGGTAYAHHYRDFNTKDFDVMIVGPWIQSRWATYWANVARPFFQERGYRIEEHTNFDRRKAISEFGQSHVRRYGIVTYKTVVGPLANDMIDINFADSDLFEGDILRTNRWYVKMNPNMYVITKNRLALDIVYDLHRGEQKRARALRMLNNLKRTRPAAEPDTNSKKIARALERSNVVVGGWSAPVRSKLYQVLLTGVAFATPWMETHGMHVVLKGGTVSTQYTNALETDDIDVQLYRTAVPMINFVPSTTQGGNVRSNERNWARYYGNGMFGAVVGFMIFMIQVLRTVDTKSIADVLSRISSNVAVDRVDFGLRISHPPKETKHITLLSIDMLVHAAQGTVTHPIFDCVLGDVRRIPSEAHFDGTLLKMHDSNTIDRNFVTMLENANPIKEEKRLVRLLEKKLGGNAKRTNLQQHIITGAAPFNIGPQVITSDAWKIIKDDFVFPTNARSKTAIGKMLAMSEGSRSSNSNSNSNGNNNITLNDIIRAQRRRRLF